MSCPSKTEWREIHLAQQDDYCAAFAKLKIALSFSLSFFLSASHQPTLSFTHTPLTGAVGLSHPCFPNCMEAMSIKMIRALFESPLQVLFGSWCLLSLLFWLWEDWNHKFSNKDVFRTGLCWYFNLLAENKYTIQRLNNTWAGDDKISQ